MNKNKYLIGLIAILLIIGSIAIAYFTIIKKETSSEDKLLYEFTFSDDYTPGSTYEISIFEKKIEIIKTSFCSAIDCEDHVEKYQYQYSKENNKKLKKFMENLDPKLLDQDSILPQDLNPYQKDVITGIIYGEYFFEIAVEEYKYKIEYFESQKLNYDIYFKEDGSILVKKLKINKDYDITNIDTYEIDFSSENMKILNNYIKKLAEEEKNEVINKSPTLYKNEKDIILSMVENNENDLINRKPIEIAYKISYQGINCLTPVLILYTDQTFEYYYTYSFNYESIKPQEGTYDYDQMVSLLGSNLSESIFNITTDYVISDNNGNYYYDYNRELLNKFLNENDIKLMTCLQSQ